MSSLRYPDAPGVAALSYTYDNFGRLSSVTNRRTNKTTYGYDSAGRLNSESYTSPAASGISYAYNTDGTVSSLTDGLGVTSYTYKANKLVESVTYAFTGLANTQKLTYSYNPDDTVSSVTWENGSTTVATWTYAYDGAGRITSVQNNSGDTTSYTYDGEGKITSQTNSNGTSTSYSYYQPRGWRTLIEHSLSGTPFASYALTYDSGTNTVGNLTGVTELSGATVSYGYDALYRLTSEIRTGSGAYSRTIGYDLAGNITTVNGSTFATYDNANKFTSIAGGSRAYDVDGNLTSVSGAGLSLGTFAYDRRDKVTQQTQGANTQTHTYDAEGKRVTKTVGATTTYFVFSGDKLIGEVTGATPSAAYT